MIDLIPDIISVCLVICPAETLPFLPASNAIISNCIGLFSTLTALVFNVINFSFDSVSIPQACGIIVPISASISTFPVAFFGFFQVIFKCEVIAFKEFPIAV